MPKILKRLVKQIKDKGKSTSAAYAIATSSLQKSGNLKKGTQKATPKGRKRGSMTPSQRAKARSAKYNGGKPSSYRYKSKNNTAVKKKR